jgi:hypothetical protein
MPAPLLETLENLNPSQLQQPCHDDQAMTAMPIAEDTHGSTVEANDRTILGLAELLLKSPARIDALTRAESRQQDLIPRFLALSLASFSLFGFTLVFLFLTVPAAALPAFLAGRWSANPVSSSLGLWLAYSLGFVIPTGICLPSFYFYGLLAGVRVSWKQVTALIMKGKASTSVLLLGILPIYMAVVLGLTVFQADAYWLQLALYLGLGLPFCAGLWGVRAIYLGFLGLADTLAPNRREHRECFLRRLTVACAGCYSAVTPLMIYTLWDYFSVHLDWIRL